MQIPSIKLHEQTPRLQQTPNVLPSASSSQAARSTSNPIERYDFENMTVGEFYDVKTELILSGRLSSEQSLDITCTIIPPFPPPGMSHEEYLAMPMRISRDQIREDIKYAGKEGRTADRDMYQRVLDFLDSLQGKPRRVDTTA